MAAVRSLGEQRPQWQASAGGANPYRFGEIERAPPSFDVDKVEHASRQSLSGSRGQMMTIAKACPVTTRQGRGGGTYVTMRVWTVMMLVQPSPLETRRVDVNSSVTT